MKTRKMKDSGVEWLGSVPEGWPVERLQWHLEEVAVKNDPVKTTNVLSLTIDRGVIPYSEKGNVGNKSKEDVSQYKIAYPETIVANSMNILIGAVGLSKYEGCVSPVYYVFRARHNACIEFFNYLFQMPAFQKELRRFANGILEIRLRVSADDILKRRLAIPTIPEQRAIAAYLDKRCAKIDAMVADAKKLIEEYKQWKASVIFEAVTGKVGVDGRCRCRKMHDSGVDWIGQVPEGWVFYPIKRFFSFFKGLNITKADLTESGIPVVSYGQIHAKNNTGTHLQDELLRHVPQHYMESCPESRLKENDFVFADTSEDLEGLGNCAFVDRSDAVMAGYHTIVLRPVKNAHFKYLAYLFRADCWRRQMREIAFGIKVYSLSQRMLRQCSLVLPPLPEQRAIAAYLDRKCAAIDRVVAEKEGLIADLERYKKSLIFECVTGKREVA